MAKMQKPRMIDKSQIKWIHVLLKKLNVDDDAYRFYLKAAFKVDSCKELTYDEAEQLIAGYERIGGMEGSRKKFVAQKRDVDVPDRASSGQVGKIWFLWLSVTRQETEEEARSALRSFMERITGISDSRFLTKVAASKMINALEAMRDAEKGKSEIKEACK